MNTKQMTFGFESVPYKSAKLLFLERMERIVPWTDTEALIRPCYPAEKSRPQGRSASFSFDRDAARTLSANMV